MPTDGQLRLPRGWREPNTTSNASTRPKNDKLDAFGLAEQLRIGTIRTKVYKKRGSFGRLGYRVKAHSLLVADSARVQSRIKALLRSSGVAVAGGNFYSTSERDERYACPGLRFPGRDACYP